MQLFFFNYTNPNLLCLWMRYKNHSLLSFVFYFNFKVDIFIFNYQEINNFRQGLLDMFMIDFVCIPLVYTQVGFLINPFI